MKNLRQCSPLISLTDEILWLLNISFLLLKSFDISIQSVSGDVPLCKQKTNSDRKSVGKSCKTFNKMNLAMDKRGVRQNFTEYLKKRDYSD